MTIATGSLPEESLVNTAIRRVLAAINLRSKTFIIEEGFVQRALSRGKPRVLGFNGFERQLVLIGRRSGSPESIVDEIGAIALEALPEEAHKFCERLVAAWLDDESRAFAAVFSLRDNGKLGPRIASSWLPPESWSPPQIDQDLAPEEILEGALARVSAVIAGRSGAATDGFKADLERALDVVDLALRFVDAEGQDRSVIPSSFESDETWATWFAYYESSVMNEWRRVGRRWSRATVPPQPASCQGPLTGVRLFISYARPDATSIAWPLHSVLAAAGASVWFDQRQQVEDESLDAGLADTIGDSDAFILCATPELFERSGYAMQEVAWALKGEQSHGRLKSCIAVLTSDTVLPTRIAHWPRLTFYRSDESVAPKLVHLVQTATPASTRGGPVAAEPRAADVPALALVADSEACLRRARHVEKFLALRSEGLIGLLNYREDKQRVTVVADHLDTIGEGLDWSGHLADIDAWPADSAVRDMRFRMASSRALVGLRRPPAEESEARLVASDVRLLTTARVPILDWPAMAGWDEHSRNFAVRHHLGVLRILRDILRRGVYLLAGVPYEVVDQWEPHLDERFRECLDFALDQRVDGTLSWLEQPPQWDNFFKDWKKVLGSHQAWLGAPPRDAMTTLLARRNEVAAAAADVAWVALRSRRSQRQWLVADEKTRATVLLSVRVDEPDPLPLPPLQDESIYVELSYVDPSKPTLRIAWKLSWARSNVGVSLARVPSFVSNLRP